jgi:hypothetical protein
MIAIRTLLLVCALSVLGLAQTGAVKNDHGQTAIIDIKEVVKRPAEYQGRQVTVTADIVSIHANYRSLDVFDANAKALIGVSLVGLPRAQRQALITEPIHRISVAGRIEMKNGRAIIRAEKVTIVSATLVTINVTSLIFFA